jgi:hypothetical protein
VYLPASQLVHTADPDALINSPAGQLVQVDAPATPDILPSLLENLPGVHFLHFDDPAEEYCPSLQLKHEVWPVIVPYFPDSHASQMLLPSTAVKFPIAHLIQLVPEITGPCVPVGQLLQASTVSW